MKNFGIFLFLSIAVFFNPMAESAEKSSFKILLSQAEIDGLIQAPKNKDLETTRQWQKLLHFERNGFGIKRSQIADPEFFLAQGALAKKTELEATLYSFFEDPERHKKLIDPPIKKSLYRPGEKIVDYSTHALCRFPARLKFLRDSLPEQNAVWAKLPHVDCVFQKIFLEALDAAKISYVFSSFYSDSPGSAFGHTFFRVQRRSNLISQQELLDYGVSYAANVTTSNGALYALLGLTGGFHGTWTNMPYYYKVREYNDYEARDLWSYELNLTPEEVTMFSYHMWEVGAHYYRYFFFTQNCASQMLTALEAVAPRLHLSDKIPFLYVLPSDSLKALREEPGLVGKIQFRPSIRKNFLARLDRLDDSDLSVFKEYVKDTSKLEVLKTEKPQHYAYRLDAALDYLDLKYSQKVNDSKTTEFRTKETLLSERAQVDFISPDLKFQIEDQEDPSLAHASGRFNFFFTDQPDQYSFAYRFSLHDLLDPKYGLPYNSQIEFFNMRFEVKENNYYLQDFFMFRVLNLNPWNFYDQKFSWGAEMSAVHHEKNCDVDIDGCLLYGGRVKAGVSAEVSAFKTQSYLWAMAVGQARYSNQLSDEYYFLSPGAEVGFVTNIGSDLSFQALYSKEFPLNYTEFETYEFKIRKSFFKKWSLALEYENDIKRAGFYYFF